VKLFTKEINGIDRSHRTVGTASILFIPFMRRKPEKQFTHENDREIVSQSLLVVASVFDQ